MKNHKINGFTLIELVMSMVLMGLVATLLSGMLIQPWMQYEQGSQRSTQVQNINRFLDKLEQDVQTSIPNTVRTTSDFLTLELFATSAYGRYRDLGARKLEPASESNTVDILGEVDASLFTNARLVINNVSNGGSIPGEFYYDAINSSAAGKIGVITADDVTLTAAQCPKPATCSDTDYVTTVSLSSAWTFVFQNCDPAGSCVEGSSQGSPSRRIYLTSGQVLYQCDNSSGEIRRYSDYTLKANMTDYASGAIADGDSGVILHNVSSCRFTYKEGTGSRAALLDVLIEVESDNGGITRLQRQIQMVNAP
jgi:MSHA biogenesis protein MshO